MRNVKMKIISFAVIVGLTLAFYVVPASAALNTIYLNDPQNTGVNVCVQFNPFVQQFLADPTSQVCQVWARSSKKGVRADNNITVDFNAYVTEFLADPTAAGTWESYGKKAGAVLFTVPEEVKELSSSGIISAKVRNSDHIFQQMVTITGEVATIQYNPATKSFSATINAGHENDTLVDLLDTSNIIDAILVPGSATIGTEQVTLASQDLDGVLAQLTALKDALTDLAGQTDYTLIKLSDLSGKTITTSDRGTTITLTLAQ